MSGLTKRVERLEGETITNKPRAWITVVLGKENVDTQKAKYCEEHGVNMDDCDFGIWSIKIVKPGDVPNKGVTNEQH